ncbi:DUF3099 domain-containing protein [Arthrobacter sp. PAMC25284]|uniref:DUF3099 domain-containing protein n=1 Tax=Arthrobacter sp. PAMC25284 TaxID=2861279 RepID=UPI0035C2449F
MTLKNRHGEPVPGDTEVHSITDAATAHSAEMRQRMIKYAVAMGIRMVCLILVFVLDGWWRLLPIIGAVFLPWVAVVIANGGDTAEIHSDSLLDNAPLAELEGQVSSAGSTGGADSGAEGPDRDDPSMVLLQGELIDDEEDDNDEDDEDDEDDNENQRRAAS